MNNILIGIRDYMFLVFAIIDLHNVIKIVALETPTKIGPAIDSFK